MKPLQIRCIPFGALALIACLTAIGAPKLGDPPEAKDLALVGYHDLQARSAYQPLIREQNGRWILYVGHHGGTESAPKPVNPLSGNAEFNGTSILDVTDPRAPRLLAHIAGDEGLGEAGGAQMVRVCSGKELPHGGPAKFYLLRPFGNAWQETGQQPGATGDVPVELHGPISTGPAGNRVYFGYGTNKAGMVQIVDRKKLLEGPPEPTTANLLYPEVGRLVLPPNVGAHTAFPLLKMDVAEFGHDKDGGTRDFIAVVDESLVNECQEARQMLWIADITTESRPFGVASFTVPEASGDFCTRGGRFGTHSSNENFTPIYYRRILFLAHFNAGVRAVDVRDPYHPREVAYFIPSITAKTEPRCVKIGEADRCKLAIQTNNVEVDDRGYIYAVDRANTGLHILELTGEARKIAAFQR